MSFVWLLFLIRFQRLLVQVRLLFGQSSSGRFVALWWIVSHSFGALSISCSADAVLPTRPTKGLAQWDG